MPEPITERSGLETPQQLAERLNLPFKGDLRLLARALTHRSYVNEHPDTPQDNERLEFLGDAVLDFIVGAWLYNHYPEMAEGKLTKMRSALVRTETLANFARTLSLGSAMRLGRGELHGGGRNRDMLLCGTFEALIGALHQTCGLNSVYEFALPLIEPAAERIFDQMQAFDPKSELQEWSQSRKLGVPQYVAVKAEGPDHARIYEIEVWIGQKQYGRGQGPSKQAAQQAAAQQTLVMIQENGEYS